MKRKAKRIFPTAAKSIPDSAKSTCPNDDGFGTSVPPSIASVAIYFDQKGLLKVARDFYDELVKRQWKTVTGQPVTNWKVCAAEWIYNYRQGVKWRIRQSPFYSELF